MTEAAKQDPGHIKNLGWRVVFAGLGINLALGVLYTWSVISKRIPADWGWSETAKSWPYAVACIVFAIVMVPAGRIQDKFSPRLAATIGGILVGAGMLFASFSTSLTGWIVGFGFLAGAGIAFGYASATPPAVKWFPAAKVGMIAGIVVCGFGLASVYISPLVTLLIKEFSFQKAVVILGVAFTVVVIGLAQLLKAPPKGYVPEGSPATGAVGGPAATKEDFKPSEMLRTWQFYVIWFLYACGAGAGLMIIAKLAAICQVQAGVTRGFIMVAALAVGNGGGRIAAGVLSDRIGRKPTFIICFVLQALMVCVLSQAVKGSVLASPAVLAVLSALIGANYGANLSLFPSITKDYYGLKNFGVNYGLVFTAWGVGGFMLALLAGKVYDATQSFTFAYYGASALLILAAIVTFCVRPPRVKLIPADTGR